MSHRRGSASPGFSLPFMMLVIGFWVVVLGLVFMYVALDLMSVIETSFAAEESTTFSSMLFDPLVFVYEGGAMTLGLGGILMLFGGVLVAASG